LFIDSIYSPQSGYEGGETTFFEVDGQVLLAVKPVVGISFFFLIFHLISSVCVARSLSLSLSLSPPSTLLLLSSPLLLSHRSCYTIMLPPSPLSPLYHT